MSRRYFVETPIEGDSALLTGQEAQHLIKVMRARRGEEVILFDGSGDEFRALVADIERSAVRLRDVVRQQANRELPFPLQLGVALPKGERQRWLVEKLTELGVTTLVPLITARGVVQPEPGTRSRLRRAVIEASKQCGRNRLLEIASPLSWSDYVLACGSSLRLFAHPRSDREGLRKLPDRGKQPVAAAVGPEGGFTEDEVALALTAGWQAVSLGPRLLRVETAAIAIAGVYAIEVG
jgi:16S rRNA (uracil1498-N3)-methyltransferase